MKRQISKYLSFRCSVLMMALLSTLTSCEDFLNQKPTDGLVLSEYWKNKEEVLSTLGGAYEYFAQLDYNLFVHGEMRADMLQETNYTGSNEKKLMSANIVPSQTYAKWTTFYKVINICNHVISIAPSVQESDPTFSDYLLQQYISEATFLRSLTYFYLVRIFQDVPFITEPSMTDGSDFFPEVTKGEDILAAIKADMITVRQKMPSFPTNEQTKCRATAGAANALLADICLWNFEYSECITYIEAIEESGTYFLLPATEWFSNFSEGFTLENIFEVYYDQGASQGNSINDDITTYNTEYKKAKFLASDYAQEILSVEPTEAAEFIRGSGSLSDRNQIWKYAGASADQVTLRSSNETTSANLIIYRLADLYLMKAEAYSQSDDEPNFIKATEYLNMVSERSNMTPYSVMSSKTDYEDAILEERAKELAYEGKRWYDLLRMGRRSEVGKAKLIEILVQNVTSSQKLVMKSRLSDTNGWYMPIHSDEISRNKNLIQNTYYNEN